MLLYSTVNKRNVNNFNSQSHLHSAIRCKQMTVRFGNRELLTMVLVTTCIIFLA